MPVLSDSEERDVDRTRRQLLAHPPGDLNRIAGITLKQVVASDSSSPNQLLKQQLAKTARMRDCKVYVFIQMEGFHLLPVDARFPGQGIQELQLRRCCCCNDAGLTLGDDRV